MKNYQKGFVNIVIAVVIVAGIVGLVAWKNDFLPKNIISGFNNKEQESQTINSDNEYSPISESNTLTKDSPKSEKIVPKASTPTKTTVTQSAGISQNASDLAEAQSNLAKINAQYQQMGIELGKKLSIVTPSGNNILEPGKPVTVVFSPVSGASSYEITITKPAYVDRSRRLISGDKIDTLFREITSETTHVIIVPKSNDYETTENGYNGENLVVKALDRSGNQLKVSVSQQGKQYEIPAMDQKQIKILTLPTQPNLLDADTYVLEKTGGTVTLKFGALQAPYVKRKLIFLCPLEVSQMASIDGVGCSGPRPTPIEFGSEAFTKKMIVKANPFPGRDTAIALRVQYYDANGNEANPEGLDDDSWLSIKIKK